MALARALPLLGRVPLLLASDFDGTLSELVRDPWGARIIPSAQRALRRLAATERVQVALISGRTVHDLAARTRIGGVHYRGDHGAEHAAAPRGFRPAAMRIEFERVGEAELEMVSRLRGEVPSAVAESWLVAEPKHGAITFHFRNAPDVGAARRQVLAAVDAVDADGLLIRSGSRRVLELRPASASTKGDALGHLIERLRPASVIMIGDDRNDALAFDVLRATRAGGGIAGLAIAVAGHADVTAEVAPHADLLLRSPRHVARFLSALARLVHQAGA